MTVEPFYQDDHVTIYHGDCLDPDLVKIWGAADVLVTDPPYGIGWKMPSWGGGRAHDGIANDDDVGCRDAALALVPNIPVVAFGSFYAPFPERLKQVLVWRKPPDSGVFGATTGYRRDAEPVFLIGPWPRLPVKWSSVLESGRRSIGAVALETGHPHTKPLDLLAGLIQNAPPGVVADPFAGSGSTLVAAKQLGRRAIGIEMEEKYCEIAASRCSEVMVLPMREPEPVVEDLRLL